VEPSPVALREARSAAHLTQRELAVKAEVSYGYVAMLESGSRTHAHPKVLLRLAGALGVGVSDLTALTWTF
jgi:transcriptional regulator with XRE-family HTH domain